MTFFRRLLSLISGPLALLLVVGIFIFGLMALLAGIVLIAKYNQITLNVIYTIPILFLFRVYFKNRKSMISEKSWKVESRTVFVLGTILMILISLNYWQGFFTAPIAFFVYGLYCIFIAYLTGEDGRKSAEKNSSDISYRFAPISSKIPKWVVGNVFFLLIISGYWFTEIQKNEQTSKNEGIQIALDLADFRVYLFPLSEVNVRVDSIESVKFVKVDSSEQPGKVIQMCITFSLEASKDGYYFENLYPPEQVCVFENTWSTGWSEYDIEEEVNKLVRAKYE